MSEPNKNKGWIKRFIRRVFGAPFEQLPPEMGDPIPPDLRIFEAQAKEAQRHPIGNARSISTHNQRNESRH